MKRLALALLIACLLAGCAPVQDERITVYVPPGGIIGSQTGPVVVELPDGRRQIVPYVMSTLPMKIVAEPIREGFDPNAP